MSSEAAQADASQVRSGRQGSLVLVVGPSGAGKDTVMRIAAARLGAESRILFPRRVITRPPDGSEANDEIGEAAFRDAEQAGAFALAWRAHGHCYGISRDILTDLDAGRAVVVNVSRRVIDEAAARFSDVRVVTVTAAPEILAARLAARGRDQDAVARLTRLAPAHRGASALVIENEGLPEAAAARLADFLREVCLG